MANSRVQSGLIIREREPVNLESPFHQLDGFLTPNELFYIRSHFEVPKVDVANYKLEISGAVARPFELSLAELRNLPSETRPATLECAGNSRIFLVPQVKGAQWELGAVGTAEWTGVPLRHLLERAELVHEAVEVVCQGADRGKPKEEPLPPDAIAYARSLALEKALAPEVLVAYQMNGKDLSEEHGSPVRLIVPGHYGMASVKWLTRIYAVTELFHGYWQTADYAYWDQAGGNPVRRPLGPMQLKSEIARPAMFEEVEAGAPYRIRGAAWCGSGNVREVEVSVDGGATWALAEFDDEARPFVWRRWHFDWHVSTEAGRRKVIARAVDESGARQPDAHDPAYGTYCIHHTLGVEVMVR